MKKRLLLIGGGGHCRSIIDSVLSLDIYDEIGIIDKSKGSLRGIPVIGMDSDIQDLFRNGWNEAFISVGSIGDTTVRRRLYEMVKKIGLIVPVIKDPTAIIAGDVEIQEGSYIGKAAVINAGTRIGACTIINSGAIVEHDCIVRDYVHISPGTTICGQVIIGNDSHIGANTVIRQQLEIGEKTIIGIGSVVTKSISSNVKAYGNPCRVVENSNNESL